MTDPIVPDGHDACPAAAVSLVPNRRSGETIIGKLKADPRALITTIEAVLHETQKRKAFDRYCRVCAELTFSYWSAKYDHPRAILVDAREKIIVARLRENQGDVSELLWALDGALKDDWVTGRDVRCRHKNDGIAYLFASRERVEQFAECTAGGRKGSKHPMVTKYLGDADVSAIVA